MIIPLLILWFLQTAKNDAKSHGITMQSWRIFDMSIGLSHLQMHHLFQFLHQRGDLNVIPFFDISLTHQSSPTFLPSYFYFLAYFADEILQDQYKLGTSGKNLLAMEYHPGSIMALYWCLLLMVIVLYLKRSCKPLFVSFLLADLNFRMCGQRWTALQPFIASPVVEVFGRSTVLSNILVIYFLPPTMTLFSISFMKEQGY